MINKIYSKIDPTVLLHIIYRHEKGGSSIKKVKAISEPEHFLQAIALEMPANATNKPHLHNAQKRETYGTHEALLVFRGSIELSVFDLDKSLVEKLILNEGDCYMIVNGGHSIRTLTHVELFEFKNGPYTGSEKDKTEFN